MHIYQPQKVIEGRRNKGASKRTKHMHDAWQMASTKAKTVCPITHTAQNFNMKAYSLGLVCNVTNFDHVIFVPMKKKKSTWRILDLRMRNSRQ